MNLPKHIFFTGVPGSKWSGIGQVIEELNSFNTSDRTTQRLYTHNGFTGHKGAYFGRLMEFEASLNTHYLDSAWTLQGGTKLVKSHDWAYCLDKIKLLFPDGSEFTTEWIENNFGQTITLNNTWPDIKVTMLK